LNQLKFGINDYPILLTVIKQQTANDCFKGKLK